jgi:ankyrin repeat protein
MYAILQEIQSGVTVKPKVDVEWRNVDGRNALMNAATKGNADNVRVLLYCSANPNSRDKDGYEFHR